MAWKVVEVGKLLSDNHAYSRRGAAIVDMARGAGAWRGWMRSNYKRPSQNIGRRVEENQFIEKDLRHESNDSSPTDAAKQQAMTKPELHLEMRLSVQVMPWGQGCVCVCVFVSNGGTIEMKELGEGGSEEEGIASL